MAFSFPALYIMSFFLSSSSSLLGHLPMGGIFLIMSNFVFADLDCSCVYISMSVKTRRALVTKSIHIAKSGRVISSACSSPKILSKSSLQDLQRSAYREGPRPECGNGISTNFLFRSKLKGPNSPWDLTIIPYHSRSNHCFLDPVHCPVFRSQGYSYWPPALCRITSVSLSLMSAGRGASNIWIKIRQILALAVHIPTL